MLIGWSAKVPDLLARLAPVSYHRVLAAGLNRAAGGPAARSTSRLESAPAADSVPTPRPAVDPLTSEASPGQPA